MELPKEVRRLLDELSIPWELRPGKKHRLLYGEGRLLGIIPHGPGNSGSRRSLKNMLANIRRFQRERLGEQPNE